MLRPRIEKQIKSRILMIKRLNYLMVLIWNHYVVNQLHFSAPKNHVVKMPQFAVHYAINVSKDTPIVLIQKSLKIFTKIFRPRLYS